MATQVTPAAEVDTFTAEWQEWHRLQEAQLSDRHGFLAITSLHWLTESPERFDDAPGAWSTGADGVVEGLEHVYDAPGLVEFEVDGQLLRLTAFPGKNPEDLLVLFTDATSGVTTYAANRAVRVPTPDADGTVVLDVNRAVNLPSAYTDLATCPLPPAENRLPIAVEAGEKIPHERQG